MTTSDFFVAGGALPPHTPSYVERPADGDLFGAVMAGHFCYVLADHHMGKSSLMFHTAWRLQQKGIRSAKFDLSSINADLDASTAYLILVKRLNFELELSIDPDKWWNEHTSQEADQRFITFLRDIILARVEHPVVVFVDSADRATLNRRFFSSLSGTIQSIYEKRTIDPVFSRLNVVLLGMSTPDDLMSHENSRLFAKGREIILTDFTYDQAQTLQRGFQLNDATGQKAVFDRILFWTNGHPYLTQKLCRAIALGNESWSPPQVDGLIEQLFITHPLSEEPNLHFIENHFKDSPHQRELLEFYREVYDGNVVANENREQKELKLIGLINTKNETVHVRNLLYREVFDPAWIKTITPFKWKRFAVIASIVLILIAAGTYLLFSRLHQQRTAETQVLTEDFRNASRAEERIDALAALWELPGSEEQAQHLFLQELKPDEQLALFDISDPLAVGEELVTVVRNTYTNPQLDDQHRYDLLEAMVDPLHQLQTAPTLGAIELELEIKQWLRGNNYYHTEKLYRRAIDAYGNAISINDSNPGTYFERGLAYAALGNPGQALADFSQALELDEAWRLHVREALINDPALYSTLWNEQNDTALIALVPTPTSTSTATPTPTPTATPTPTPTATTAPPTDTPTPVPTATPTSTPFPTATATPNRPARPTDTPTPIAPDGVLTLLHPTLDDDPSHGSTQFEWQWVGNLPPDFGFEVRVWKADNIPTGVHNSVLDNQNGNIKYIGNDTYQLDTNITDAAGIRGSGEYLWTVALVRITPDYEDIGQQAEPGQLLYAAPGSSGGDGDTSDGDSSGGGGGGVGIK